MVFFNRELAQEFEGALWAAGMRPKLLATRTLYAPFANTSPLSGTRELAELDRRARCGHHRGEDAVTHTVYVILEQMLIQTVSAVWMVAALVAAENPRPAVARS